jgi:cell volume regulation protein A
MEGLQVTDEIIEFGRLVLIVGGGFTLAVVSNKLSARIRVPAPALLLLAAAVASDLAPAVHEHLSVRDVERIAVVALVLILFDGGMDVGWRRFRASAVPIGSLGVVGTFATAGVMATAAHYLFGFDWTVAWIIGTALAPTDPAVMFSVLGRREVSGRSGTILEGESGANDPVGIALMIGLLEFAANDRGSIGGIAAEFALEMAVGLGIGVAGAALLLPFMRRVALPNEALYTLRTLAAAGLIYGVAAVAHGSGFLAVFVAGILIGDARAPYKAEIERFHKSLASLSEIVVFVTLGVTIDLGSLGQGSLWLDGLLLALILAFLARPLVVGTLVLRVRLRWGERLFVMWGGLKGAVPILLGAFAVLAAVDDAERVYGIVFVVVAFSVIVQGGSIPFAAARLGVPIREVEPEPWNVSVRLRQEPRGIERYVVEGGSPAAGTAIRDLPLGAEAWISIVIRDGKAAAPRGSQVLEPGDELLVLTEAERMDALRRLFGAPHTPAH